MNLRDYFSVFLLLVLFTLVPYYVAAQAPAITWERLGSGITNLEQDEVKGIAFRHGGAEDGSLDTLYAVNAYSVFRLAPEAEEWNEMCPHTWCLGDYMTATKEGYLLVGSPAGPASDGARSTDGGRTWENDVVGTSVALLFQSTLPILDGAVYACDAAFCDYSFDGGAAGSWIDGPPMGGSPAALAEVVLSTALPEGRLLGGTWNGAAYSDDGAETWTSSSLWQPGRFVVNDLTFAPDSDHPFGGVAYAGVRDFGLVRPAVYRSDDGGETWTLMLEVNPGDYDLAGPDWIVVQASGVADGVVYAGIEDTIAGPDPSVGTVLASADGGQTWAEVADSTNGWEGWAPRVFEVGRDGRLYAGTDRGVYRTIEPVAVSVEEEPAVPGKSVIELDVYPNPMGGEATFAFSLPRAGPVTLRIYDAIGRLVATPIAGTYPVGTTRLQWQAGHLPSGVYVARLQAGVHRATRQLVIRR